MNAHNPDRTSYVYLAHPDRLFREALASALSKDQENRLMNFEIVETAISVFDIDVERYAAGKGNQVLVFDFADEEDHVRSYLAAARSANPDLRTLVITSDLSWEKVGLCLEGGVNACLMHDLSVHSFLHYLQFVAIGESMLPREVAKMCFETFQNRSHGSMPCQLPVDLAERELAILEYLTEGASNKVIARHLNISDATVKVNIKTILRKINASNRTEAAAWAIRHNIVADSSGPEPMLIGANNNDSRMVGEMALGRT